MPRLKQPSIAELKSELARKEHHAAKLCAKRNGLLAKLAALDTRLAELSGEAPVHAPAPDQAPAVKPWPRATRRRIRKGTIVQTIEDVLRAAPEPMNVAAIAAALEERRVKTKSGNLPRLVRRLLYLTKGVKRTARGLYTAA